jgi:hypothetical protein
MLKPTVRPQLIFLTRTPSSDPPPRSSQYLLQNELSHQHQPMAILRNRLSRTWLQHSKEKTSPHLCLPLNQSPVLLGLGTSQLLYHQSPGAVGNRLDASRTHVLHRRSHLCHQRRQDRSRHLSDGSREHRQLLRRKKPDHHSLSMPVETQQLRSRLLEAIRSSA